MYSRILKFNISINTWQWAAHIYLMVIVATVVWSTYKTWPPYCPGIWKVLVFCAQEVVTLGQTG